jgi:hypothetical protein
MDDKIKQINLVCPMGKLCEEESNGVVTRCRWYLPFTTTLPGTTQPAEVWKCAMVWTPLLLVEQLQMARQIHMNKK